MGVELVLEALHQLKLGEGVMKMIKAMQVIGLALAMVFTMGLGLVGAAEYCPDNFIFLVDQSGSMYMFGDSNLKIALSKKTLLNINDQIPLTNYRGANFMAALELFAPVQELYSPGPYDRAAMAKGIKGIKDDHEVFGRLTPMGPGMLSLEPVLAKMTGNTAVILVTDGMSNQGDPVAGARVIYSVYPNTYIHIISVADAKDKEGREILTAINKLKNGSIMVEGVTLNADRAALEKFVREVFCTPKKEITEEVLILRGIHFDFNKYNIKPEWRVVLDEGVATLTRRPDMKIMIEGHTDSIGTIRYNQKLSERRAKAVFDYFVAKGISASRMQTIGYGKTEPKASNATAEGRAINRRVELKVVQ
jgi:OmpA-OmpF porin, OOP family